MARAPLVLSLSLLALASCASAQSLEASPPQPPAPWPSPPQRQEHFLVATPPALPLSFATATEKGPGDEAPAPAPAPALLPLPDVGPRSSALASGLFNPMPGGLLSGYRQDTGLDIAGYKRPVFAVAPGTLDYAEAGHTRWTGKGDSRFTVRLALDRPIGWKGHQITHAYYGHLSSLAREQPSGSEKKFHVEAGQQLGVSGFANGSPHLHLGLLLDGHVEQDDWAFILDEGEVREVLGSLSNGKKI